jgi:hypothetical protein
VNAPGGRSQGPDGGSVGGDTRAGVSRDRAVSGGEETAQPQDRHGRVAG